jgi:hypothetical protein
MLDARIPSQNVFHHTCAYPAINVSHLSLTHRQCMPGEATPRWPPQAPQAPCSSLKCVSWTSRSWQTLRLLHTLVGDMSVVAARTNHGTGAWVCSHHSVHVRHVLYLGVSWPCFTSSNMACGRQPARLSLCYEAPHAIEHPTIAHSSVPHCKHPPWPNQRSAQNPCLAQPFVLVCHP